MAINKTKTTEKAYCATVEQKTESPFYDFWNSKNNKMWKSQLRHLIFKDEDNDSVAFCSFLCFILIRYGCQMLPLWLLISSQVAVRSSLSVEIVEVATLRDSLKIALKASLTPLAIEMDSMSLANLINNTSQSLGEVDLIGQDIKDLLVLIPLRCLSFHALQTQ